jgi:hypothetical protein
VFSSDEGENDVVKDKAGNLEYKNPLDHLDVPARERKAPVVKYNPA